MSVFKRVSPYNKPLSASKIVAEVDEVLDVAVLGEYLGRVVGSLDLGTTPDREREYYRKHHYRH